MTIEYSIDDPPTIRWDGILTGDRLADIRRALNDMNRWRPDAQVLRDGPGTWQDEVALQWGRRRVAANREAVQQMEFTLSHPYVCPGCGRQRCKTLGGLKSHMRACRRVDPFKLQRGGYDDAMVPGGPADR